MTRWPAVAALALALGTPVGTAPRSWTLVQTSSVTVVGQQPAGRLRAIAARIEQFRAALGSLIRGAEQPPPMPTIVYAFDDRTALEPYLPLYHGKPAALGGYCHCGSSTNANVIAVSLPSFANSSAIIFHEYTHVLIRSAAPAIPLWLNEGLAEFYSSFALADGGRSMVIGRPLENHLAMLQQHGFIPLADFLQVGASSPLYHEANRQSTFYAEAWALTHYLLVERRDSAPAVDRYLAAVAHGERADAAFAAAFGEPVHRIESALKKYVGRPVLKSLVVPISGPLSVVEPERVRVLSAPEAEARLAGLQLGVQRTAEAAPRIEAAAAAGAAVPEAQLALGLLRVQQQRMDEAWPPFERAAALAPDDFMTQFTYALMLLRQDIDDRDRAGPSIERARAALSRALAANPQSPDALAWQAFADLLLDAHIDEAHAAIARAIALAPGRVDFRIRQAEVLLRERRDDEARAILTPITASGDRAAAREAESLLAAAAERNRRAAGRAAVVAAAEGAARSRSGPVRTAHNVDDRPAPAAGGRRIVLRTVKPGEERAYGDLTSIECEDASVRFTVRAGSRTIVAIARRVQDVAFLSYLDDPAFAPECGPRTPPDVVFLTWRMASVPVGQSGVIGQAVAVEFVPRDYVP